MDEAYADFSEKGSLAKEATVRENLIVLQTLSKARAMAGLRIGLAISSEEVIRLMSMVKYPYNLSRAAMEKAFLFLDKSIDDEVNTIVNERKRLASILPRFPFVQQVFPSTMRTPSMIISWARASSSGTGRGCPAARAASA